MTIRAFAPKDPDEKDFFNIDFSDRMPPSDTIASIVTVFVDEANSTDAALLIDQFAHNNDKIVSGRWQAGTAEGTYRITARVDTTEGRTLDKSGTVYVTDN